MHSGQDLTAALALNVQSRQKLSQKLSQIVGFDPDALGKEAQGEAKSKYVQVQRKQFPLMPALAMPLYSMQGTTADPGMVAYWAFPQICSPTIKWLIIYVILSRPRCLANLQSIGLTEKVRTAMEAGPPEDLVSNFHKLFDAKIHDTKTEAMRAAKHYGLLPEFF